MPRVRILLVEDNPEDTKIMQQAVAQDETPYDITIVGRLSDALRRIGEATPPDLVLLDLKLPDSDGIKTLERLRREAPTTPVIVLTGSDDEELVNAAMHKGANDYVVKGYVQVYPNLLGRAIRYTMERQRGREAVRRAHAQTEQLLGAIPSILIRVTPTGTVIFWNSVAEITFGIEGADAVGRPLAESGIRWDLQEIQKAITHCRSTGATVFLDDLPFKRADGRDGFLGISIVPMGSDGVDGGPSVLIFAADVTARKQMELERAKLQDQLVQSQKMETIGRFAGGIAHDFNNFLQVILGFAWLIQSREPKNTKMIGDLEEIVHAAESASGMVYQLLAFSRRQPLQAKLLEMNQTVRSMNKLLRQFAGEHIRVDLELSPTPLFVKLDPTRLEQILMNLCANARDSMDEGGALTIQTAGQRVDEAFLDVHPGASLGDYVGISIRDTGEGMDPGVAAHIFEPFFTTKKTGKGTGLGLAVVYGLVQQHDGFVYVETGLGEGTTFHLYFPAQPVTEEEREAILEAGDGDAALNGDSSAAAGRQALAQQTRRRLLVVDDDPAIRRLCERVLKPNYEVTTVSSGRAALEELERKPYNVLLSDLRMPNMDGVSLLKEVVKLKNPPALMAMTGSISEEMEQRLESVPLAMKVIHKPFTAPTLLDVVNRCIMRG